MADRQVFQGPDGPYVERAAGAGPRHHDDIPLTPADVEAKAHGAIEPNVKDLLAGAPTIGPGSATMEMSGPMPVVHLALGPRGIAGWVVGADPLELDRLRTLARACRGVIVSLPVHADYR